MTGNCKAILVALQYLRDRGISVRIACVTASPTRVRSQADRSVKEVWGRLLNLVIATDARRDLLVELLGLTSGDSRALMALDRPTVRTMGTLADEWRCDASTATRAVDRLESRRLA